MPQPGQDPSLDEEYASPASTYEVQNVLTSKVQPPGHKKTRILAFVLLGQGEMADVNYCISGSHNSCMRP